MSQAKFGFLPWIRQGLSANINETDTFGVLSDKTGRPTIDINLNLSGIRIDARTYEAITDSGEEVSESGKLVSNTVEFISPGDITGINSTAVIKTEPRADVSTFEPNYLPYIEFYEEDFPWRYTPASANDGKLRPWLVLVVLEQGEFERRFLTGAPLPAVQINEAQNAFPPEAETWAWAHVQVNRPLEEEDKPIGLKKLVNDNPNLASARLLCPRRLNSNTSYTAFLLPAFEQGRLSGLGAPVDRINSTDIQSSSWGSNPSDEYTNLWPIYYEWDFRTSDLADFEFLVRRIKPRVLEDPVGRRPIDLQDSGYELSYTGGDGTVFLEGALQIVDADESRDDFLTEEEDKKNFVEELQTLLNLNSELIAGNEEQDDPFITPPLYGQWHADLFKADASNPVHWFNELNLDPRNRVAAGFGTLVVRTNQDAYVDRAWEQVGALLEIQRRIRLNRFASEVGLKMQQSYFEKMDESAFSAFSSSFHQRTPYDENQELDNATILEVVNGQRVKPKALRELEISTKNTLEEKREALSTARATRDAIIEAIELKEAEIAVTEALIETLDGQIEQLNNEVEALETEIETQNERIQLKREEISTKQTEIEAKEQEIAALDQNNPSNQDALEALNAELAVLNNELSILQGELNTLEGELDTLEGEKASKEGELSDKESERTIANSNLATQQSELNQLNADLAAVNLEIENLEQEINELNGKIANLIRLFLPTSALRQEYRKLARSNSPLIRRSLGGITGKDALEVLSQDINTTSEGVDEQPLEETFNSKEWGELNWGAASYSEPDDSPVEDVLAIEFVLPRAVTTNAITTSVQNKIKAPRALNKQLQTSFGVQSNVLNQSDDSPNPLMAYPEFKEAMYDALADISSELMLPNLQLIPVDTFSILEINQRFIESYLVGLNHEMARELLWREYPTDQRGSYFRRFWDDLDNLDSTPPPPDIKILTELDQPLGRNLPTDSKISLKDSDEPTLVFVIRSELLKKFPNTLVYMQKADWVDDEKQARRLSEERVMPVFKASVFPEVTFYGFPITAEDALGDAEVDAGWFFVVQERPGEPRFGMDIGEENNTDEEPFEQWNDLSWSMMDLDENGFIRLDGLELSGNEFPPKREVSNQYTWAKNSSHMAGILLQLPFMVAVHATDMIKLPGDE